MIKKILLIIVLTLFSTNLIAAGTDRTSKVKSDYDKAVTHIKAAKKYEKKGKLEKAKKRYEIPFNCYNYGYVTNQLNTPLVPLLSQPTLNFHPSYGPEKDMCC